MDDKKKLLRSVASLLGPASTEFGELLADNVRLWRWQRALTIIDRATKIREARPEAHQGVSLKFFLPFLEEASKENDEELTEWWARLLASSSEETSGFDQACTDILRSLGKREARMLIRVSELTTRDTITEYLMQKLLDDKHEPNYEFESMVDGLFLLETRRKGWPDWKPDISEADLCALLTLEKLRLVDEQDFPLYYVNDLYDRYDISYITITRLGHAFQPCRRLPLIV